MGFFSGKKERLDLSDEALLAAAEMAAAEENGDPYTSNGDGDVLRKGGDMAKWDMLQAQYNEMRNRLPDIYRSLAKEKQARQELAQMMSRLMAERNQGATANGEATDGYLRQAGRRQGGVSRKVQESLRPLLEAMRQNQQRDSFDRALRGVQALFPQATDPAEAQRLMQRMIQRSRFWGEDDIWRKHPEEMMKIAALDLYGVPQAQDVGENATGEEARTAREILSRNADKAGLAIYPKNNKGSQSEPSEEEKIIKGIFNAGKGRFFD